MLVMQDPGVSIPGRDAQKSSVENELGLFDWSRRNKEHSGKVYGKGIVRVGKSHAL